MQINVKYTRLHGLGHCLLELKSQKWMLLSKKKKTTWRARVSSSRICSWTLKGAVFSSCPPRFGRSKPEGFEGCSEGAEWRTLLTFLLGMALFMASWKRTDLSRSNWALTEWSRSLRIKTYSKDENQHKDHVKTKKCTFLDILNA